MALVRGTLFCVGIMLLAVVGVRHIGAATDDPIIWHYVADSHQPFWLVDMEDPLIAPHQVEIPVNLQDVVKFQDHVLVVTTRSIWRYVQDNNQFVRLDLGLDPNDTIVSVAPSPHHLAIVVENRTQSTHITTVYLTDLATQQIVYQGSRALRQMQWSPDYTWLAAAYFDDRQTMIYRLDPERNTLTWLHTLPDVVVSLAISPDSNMIAAAMIGTNQRSSVVLFATEPSQSTITSINIGYFVAWFPTDDGLIILRPDGTIEIDRLDAAWRVSDTFVPSIPGRRPRTISHLQWVDGVAVMAAYRDFLDDAYVYAYNPESGEITNLSQHPVNELGSTSGIMSDLVVADMPFSLYPQWELVALAVSLLTVATRSMHWRR